MGASAQAPWTTSVSTTWWPRGAGEPGSRDRGGLLGQTAKRPSGQDSLQPGDLKDSGSSSVKWAVELSDLQDLFQL